MNTGFNFILSFRKLVKLTFVENVCNLDYKYDCKHMCGMLKTFPNTTENSKWRKWFVSDKYVASTILTTTVTFRLHSNLLH